MRKMVAVGLLSIAACKAAPPPKPVIDQAKFEPLYRAGKTVQASLAVGLTHQRFGELQQAFATEISIGNDKAATENERALVAAYHAALMTLQESGLIWKHKLDNARYDFIPEGRVYMEAPLFPIAEKYGLAQRVHDPHGKPWHSVSEDGIQTIWTRAGQELDYANKLYYEIDGAPVPALAALTPQPAPPATPTSTAPPKAPKQRTYTMADYRRLSNGMPFDEVRKILGAPTSGSGTSSSDYRLCRWDNSDGTGIVVSFTRGVASGMSDIGVR